MYYNHLTLIERTAIFYRGMRGDSIRSIARYLDRSHSTVVRETDPYSFWQRGSNEQVNGLIRRYFPKKMSFENITDKMVKEVANKINNRPRKCLNYRTPVEVLGGAL